MKEICFRQNHPLIKKHFYKYIILWSQHNNKLDSMIDTTGINVFIRYCKTRFDNWHDCNLTVNYVTYRCVIAITGMQSLHYPPPPQPKSGLALPQEEVN